MRKYLFISILCMPLVAGAAEAIRDSSANTYDSIEGVWESSYGHMFFTLRTSLGPVEAPAGKTGMRAAFWAYPDSNGVTDNARLIGTVDDRSFDGFWIQDSGQSPCATERDGSLFWGITRFEANTDFTEMTGTWGYCDVEPEANEDGRWVVWRDELRNWEPEKD
jgi:hypothetical protein